MTDTQASSSAILPKEGMHVIHAFYQTGPGGISREAARELGQELTELAEEANLRENTQLLLFSMVSPKADLGFMLLTRDLHVADEISKQLTARIGSAGCFRVASYLSMTERSEYTTSGEEYAQELKAKEQLEPGTKEFEEKMEAFRARIEKYTKDRLYPKLPDWPVMCFYPMSKKREAGQNWYGLTFDRRKELMKGHARVGRTYAGRILQLITGSTGLDMMEWGVTLFAHSTSDIKEIVYEMRFDEVSTDYAEFGDFLIGLRMSGSDLAERLTSETT
jgi:peroxiredoxin